MVKSNNKNNNNIYFLSLLLIPLKVLKRLGFRPSLSILGQVFQPQQNKNVYIWFCRSFLHISSLLAEYQSSRLYNLLNHQAGVELDVLPFDVAGLPLQNAGGPICLPGQTCVMQ